MPTVERHFDKVGKTKIALLATASALQFGLTRQFQIKAEFRTKANLGVFREEYAAIKWLLAPKLSERRDAVEAIL
ncbi:MAG: hypothetical protein ABI999_15050 [Acidobacteriota bacterium]